MNEDDRAAERRRANYLRLERIVEMAKQDLERVMAVVEAKDDDEDDDDDDGIHFGA